MGRVVLLDGKWRFAAYPEGLGERQGAFKSVYDVRGWLDVAGPGELPVGLERGDAGELEFWYRMEFTLSCDTDPKQVALDRGPFPESATVWLNGEPLREGSVPLHGPNSVAVRFYPSARDAIRAEPSPAGRR